ncbi:hypothetical protein LOTGIDRAFT_133000 [Lottia gigantea]|uniref:RBR-type E3 ubiquitin transferase n=1 Tax=Lottia gigantea TaxID=225164 RepID=V3ZMH4_LOTGI|nr:hypothetical protein LOTGIDRAFT_133000 [Lottia gigantea]ESO83650.1 hypothetical protein LOTGIDRAFT_133000 [Lottia gigantea]
MDDDEDEFDTSYYYDNNDDLDLEKPKKSDDPEYFEYELLKIEDVERMLNEEVEALCTSLKIAPSLAKMLLHAHGWRRSQIIERHQMNAEKFLVESRIVADKKNISQVQFIFSYGGGDRPGCFLLQEVITGTTHTCSICVRELSKSEFQSLSCHHIFCNECWDMHFGIQISKGLTTGIECMGSDCKLLVPEDFICSILKDPSSREKYFKFSFSDLIDSHSQLRFCPGPNCSIVVRAKEPKSKRVECKSCKSTFCFRCGIDYHAPTDCDTIKKWLMKCADDSETANYISANTKDCPKCHVCIEKNGGCNHMQCSKCKSDFCWMCLGEWKTHGSEYYECSRFKENPNIANESVHVQAREALKKYLFYYERWENHAKSLTLEEQTLKNITTRIEEKVMNNEGTWIAWQYLLKAADLLKKCRYSLQYTYPYAYYLDRGGRKELFEYQQAQLEAEVENLSWKVERAEISDTGELENLMDIAEKRRLTLLKDFLEV